MGSGGHQASKASALPAIRAGHAHPLHDTADLQIATGHRKQREAPQFRAQLRGARRRGQRVPELCNGHPDRAQLQGLLRRGHHWRRGSILSNLAKRDGHLRVLIVVDRQGLADAIRRALQKACQAGRIFCLFNPLAHRRVKAILVDSLHLALREEEDLSLSCARASVHVSERHFAPLDTEQDVGHLPAGIADVKQHARGAVVLRDRPARRLPSPREPLQPPPSRRHGHRRQRRGQEASQGDRGERPTHSCDASTSSGRDRQAGSHAWPRARCKHQGVSSKRRMSRLDGVRRRTEHEVRVLLWRPHARPKLL
mmetsp:Transcript_151720/g.486804  ORF Transcript_151720/g.486804 Transcript_151720/m.486804 type:complete len:311 (-) Transcript_151720:6-938(-)